VASEKKVVDHLEDWFDALIILQDRPGDPSRASQVLAPRFEARSVYWVRPASDAIAVRSGPSQQSWSVDCAPSDGQALVDLLSDRKVRRPLVVAEGEKFGEILKLLPEAFKVYAPAFDSGLKNKLSELFNKAPSASTPALFLLLFDALIAPDIPSMAKIKGEVDFTGFEFVWSKTASYEALETPLLTGVNELLSKEKHLNILVLYDDTFTHIKPVWEHLTAFREHSRHQYFYLPSANSAEFRDPLSQVERHALDFSMFDAVVWHYSIRAALPDHIHPAIGERLEAFDGLKILFIQDEYDHVEMTWSWIRKIRFDVVMTCAPDPETAQILYPPDQAPGVELISNLTGYVPADDIERFAIPLESRDLRLSYRGRVLAHRYGDLGREKYLIGLKMKALAQERGVPADVEVDETHRIYGDDWYRFMASARATLASESGANVADFDGSLKHLNDEAIQAGVSYEDFHAQHLGGRDGQIRMNQISPKVFEAVRLRTALVCFEGKYSGVLQPDIHYIPLKKDFSNIEEVFSRLEDLEYLRALTDRAYRDIIESGAWSHRAFVQEFDSIVQSRRLRGARNEIITAPIALRGRGGGEPVAIAHVQPIEWTLNTGVLRKPTSRAVFTKMMTINREIERGNPTYRISQPDRPPEDAVLASKLAVENFIPTFEGAIEHMNGEMGVRTSDTPWGYAAFCALDLSRVSLEYEHCWVHVRVRNVSGDILVGAYSSDVPSELTEIGLAEGAGEQDIFIPVAGDQNTLLFRNGEMGRPSRAILMSAEVWSAPALEPKFLEVAQRLVAEHHPIVTEGPGPVYAIRRSPFEAPEEAVIVAISTASDAHAAGGSTGPAKHGVRITTPDAQWAFGVAVDLDLSRVQFEHEYCWVRVFMENTSGDLKLALWGRDSGGLVMERSCSPREQELILSIPDEGFGSLMFRSGAVGTGATTFIRAEVLTATRYTRSLQDLLDRYANRTVGDA
jgi:hypothetical protein